MLSHRKYRKIYFFVDRKLTDFLKMFCTRENFEFVNEFRNLNELVSRVHEQCRIKKFFAPCYTGETLKQGAKAIFSFFGVILVKLYLWVQKVHYFYIPIHKKMAKISHKRYIYKRVYRKFCTLQTIPSSEGIFSAPKGKITCTRLHLLAHTLGKLVMIGSVRCGK